MSFYGTDLAYVHHAGFRDLSQSVAQWIAKLISGNAARRSKVVDLGSGSGVLAATLSARGYHVVGVDSSAAMIRLAKRTAPDADFIRSSLFEVAIPACDCVTAIGEPMNYAVHGLRKPGLAGLFRRVHRSLCPGGLFVFDVVTGPVTKQLAPQRTYHMGDDWAVLVDVVAQSDHRLARHVTIFRKVGRTYRRSEETHTVWLFDRDIVLHQLRQAGFRVRRVKRYGDVSLLPSRVGFVARRKTSVWRERTRAAGK